VAVKELRPQGRSQQRLVEREIKTMARLRHPHVVGFFGLATNPYRLVMELAQCSVYDLIRNEEEEEEAPFPETGKTKSLFDISNGMRYLHEQRILHRDLKAENCLVTSLPSPKEPPGSFFFKLVVKVSDFGLARLAGDALTPGVGTRRFMAPEVLSHEDYSYAADVYSYGALGLELAPCAPWLRTLLQRAAGAVPDRPGFRDISARFHFEGRFPVAPHREVTVESEYVQAPARDAPVREALSEACGEEGEPLPEAWHPLPDSKAKLGAYFQPEPRAQSTGDGSL